MGWLVLFDVRLSTGMYLNPSEVCSLAERMGLTPVPTHVTVLPMGPERDEKLQDMMTAVSVLGGPVEGIVIKNYSLEHPERPGHPMTAKLVRPEFKEKHSETFCHKERSGQDHIQRIINQLKTEARWCKAIQHLREAGTLEKVEKDIGPLVREIQRDVLEEEKDWIGQQLFEIFSKDIAKGVVQGFAQYYKNILNDGMTVYQEHETTAPSQSA